MLLHARNYAQFCAYIIWFKSPYKVLFPFHGQENAAREAKWLVRGWAKIWALVCPPELMLPQLSALPPMCTVSGRALLQTPVATGHPAVSALAWPRLLCASQAGAPFQRWWIHLSYSWWSMSPTPLRKQCEFNNLHLWSLSVNCGINVWKGREVTASASGACGASLLCLEWSSTATVWTEWFCLHSHRDGGSLGYC